MAPVGHAAGWVGLERADVVGFRCLFLRCLGGGFGVEHLADGAVGGGGWVAVVVEEVGVGRGAGGGVFVVDEAAGAGVGGIGEAVLGGVGDDLVEEGSPL